MKAAVDPNAINDNNMIFNRMTVPFFELMRGAVLHEFLVRGNGCTTPTGAQVAMRDLDVPIVVATQRSERIRVPLCIRPGLGYVLVHRKNIGQIIGMPATALYSAVACAAPGGTRVRRVGL